MPDRHLKLWIDRNKPKNIPARHSNPNSPLPRPAYVAPDNSQRNHHQNFPGGRQLQPWSSTEEDDSTNHLPSDSERTESTTTETEEDDDEDNDELIVEAQRRQAEQSWSTTQQGTDALQALFFGGSGGGGDAASETDRGDVTLRQDPGVPDQTAPLAPPPPLHAFTLGHAPSEQPVRPLAVAAAPSQSSQLSTPNSIHSHSTLHATPPQVAYERQQSFVQPKPTQSQNQQTRLLDLLTGSAATPPPPPLPPAEIQGQGQGQSQSQQAGPMTVAALEQQVNFARSALGTLTLDTPSPLAQQLPLPAHLPVSASNSVYSSHQPSPAPHDPVFVSDLEDSQKQEKRDALLRALLSVAAKSPPKPPPQELEPHAQDARWFASPPLQHAIQPPPPLASNVHNNSSGGGGGGSLLSILNGNDRMSAAAAPAYGHSPQLAPQHAMSLPHPGLPPSVVMSTGPSYPSLQQYPSPLAAAYGPHAQQQQQQQPSPHMNVSSPPMVPMPPYPNPPQQYQSQQYAQPPYHQPSPSFPPHHLRGPAGPSSSSQQPSIPPHVHPSSFASTNNHPTMSQQPYATGLAQHGALPPMPPPVPIVPSTGGPGGSGGVQQPQARVHPGHLLGLLNGRS